jgi:Sulfotransferase family
VSEVSEVSKVGLSADAQSPVFVLCAARSGSTLLRFLLDAHPDLACPPETKLPAMCAQLAGVWSLLEGTPWDGDATDPQAIPEPAVAGMRRALDDMVGEYLRRRGKLRFCDKSLGAASQAALLLRIFPDARFICLYRHPMDMIASGIEACPWGLNGFGFDAYAAMSPGNSVQALAQFWIDNMSAILAVEERLPQRCYRVRYEDLVADPETVTHGIFRFLGVTPSPGISRQCFGPDREPIGPADYKIWQTSEITADSVGRGWSIPATPIRLALREAINGLAGKLGYVAVTEQWGAAAVAPDMRVRGSEPPIAAPVPRKEGMLVPLGHRALAARLEAGLAAMSDTFASRWALHATETFLIASTAPGGSGIAIRWRIDLSERTLTVVAGMPSADTDGARWEIVGSSDAWEKILNRDANLGVVFLDGQAGHGAVLPQARHTVEFIPMTDGIPRPPRPLPSLPSGPLQVSRAPRPLPESPGGSAGSRVFGQGGWGRLAGAAGRPAGTGTSAQQAGWETAAPWAGAGGVTGGGPGGAPRWG